MLLCVTSVLRVFELYLVIAHQPCYGFRPG